MSERGCSKREVIIGTSNGEMSNCDCVIMLRAVTSPKLVKTRSYRSHGESPGLINKLSRRDLHCRPSDTRAQLERSKRHCIITLGEHKANVLLSVDGRGSQTRHRN